MTNLVSLQKCKSYDYQVLKDAIGKLLEPWNGLQTIVHPEQRVLLKPNLLSAKAANRAVTTHPAIIEAVIEKVITCGAKPYIADSPPLPSAHRVCRACGIDEVAKRHQVEIIEFRRPSKNSRKTPVHTESIETPSIDQSINDFDVIINLPKVKAHQQMLLTCAVKNLFGCVNGRRKAYWHYRLRNSPYEFARMLLAVLERTQPELSLVDGVVGMEGMGPVQGTPKSLGFLAAGENPIAIDRVISEILSIDWKEYFVLTAAKDLGMEGWDLEQIPLHGNSIDELRIKDFELPEIIPIGFSIPHLVKGIFRYLSRRISGLKKTIPNPAD